MKARGIVLLNNKPKGAPASMDSPLRFRGLFEMALCLIYLEAHHESAERSHPRNREKGDAARFDPVGPPTLLYKPRSKRAASPFSPSGSLFLSGTGFLASAGGHLSGGLGSRGFLLLCIGHARPHCFH